MFVDVSEYDWVPMLEATTPDILAELDALGEEAFEAWPERHLYGSGWNSFGFRILGRDLVANATRCPKTKAALDRIPGLLSAGFSLLEPGTWIRPHIGYSHSLYVGHLGLIVPEDCAIRVGRQTRGWAPGRFFAFDDMVEHEAWNRGETRRVVLLIEFLRPGCAFSDFAASPQVEAMLAALDPA